ncbi:MAG: hypothetical protein KGS72_23420 [Cyanobacteria bacterium REEB67]|nr:hypothetical protein [Cyanobacteria bacterium REEB67]
MTNNMQSQQDAFGSAPSPMGALMASTSIPKINPPFSPLGDPQIMQMATQPATSPEDAAAKYAAHRVPEDLVLPEFMAAGSPPIEGAPSIAEQARALKNDPDLIYQFVHDNIDFYPNYGLHKGGWGALIDSNGNAFDQSDLMIQLLTAAAIPAQFVTGTVTLTAAQWSNWLNIGTADLALAASLLSNGGFAVSSNAGANTLTFNHCWVQATIGGVNYQFDPAIKSYNTIAGINLASTMGYNRTNFLAHAQTGATITADYVTAIKAAGTVGSPGINDDLNSYAASLASYIKNTSPVPNVDQILGGRSVVPVAGPVRNTVLPYANAGFTLNTSLPAAFKATIQFNFDNSSGSFATSITFNTADIYGLRQTFWYNTATNTYTIFVNGVSKKVTAAQTTGVTKTLSFTITHPYATTAFDQTTATSIVTGQSYAIGTGFGYASRQVAEIHRQALANTIKGTNTAENVLGESLSIIWYNFLGQYGVGADFINRLGSTYSAFHHNVGVIALVPAGSTTQILVNFFTNYFSTSGLKTTSVLGSASQQMTLLWHQLEGTVTTGISGASSVTTPVVIAAYNNQSASDRTYVATQSNWYTTVRAALAAGGYSSTVLDGIELSFIAREQISFGGSVSSGGGDVPKLNISNSLLATNPTVLTYTTVVGDTLSSIATAFYNLVISNSALTAINLTADNGGTVIQIRQTATSSVSTTYTSTVTGSVTMTLGRNTLTIPQSGNVTIGAGFAGYGYYVQDFFGRNFLGPLVGTLKGALSGSVSVDQVNTGGLVNSSDVNGNGRPLGAVIVSAEPIDLFKGRYNFDSIDLSVGNQGEPYQLSLKRSYNSGGAQYSSGLGLGWHHNFQMGVQPSSDGFIAFGFDTPVAAAAVIAQMYVCMDVLSSTQPTIPLANVVTLSISNVWMMNRMVNNTLLVQAGSTFETFAKLADGTFVAPLGTTAATSVAFNSSTSTYSYTTLDKVVYSFNTSNRISSIQYPFGMTINFIYTGNNLTQVTNGLRTLTLSYDGNNNLLSVTDGTNTVHYSVNASNQLTAFQDALTHSTTYGYSSSTSGLLTTIKNPANPASPVVTNVYDSLSRIKTQSDAYGNLWTYYFAGSRSEEVDPNSNSTVYYFDGFGSALKIIDQLGNITNSSFDGLKRPLFITAPEGNKTGYTYDSVGNVLSLVLYPKPSSPITYTITRTFTYDLAWNKVNVATDANGKQIIFTHNPVTGTLSKIQYPAVIAGTPVTNFTYNARGQMLTVIDPSGVQTSNTYDPSTGDVLSSSLGSQTGGLNLTANFTYDAVGNLFHVTDPKSNTTVLQFDANRNLIQVQGPAPFNYLTTYTYDANNNLKTTQTMADGGANQTYTYIYTIDDLLSQINEPPINFGLTAPLPTIYQFDNMRRMQQSTDPLGRVYQYSYDARENLFQTTFPNGVISDTRTYTPNGLLSTITAAMGQMTQFTLDGFDRRVATTYPDSTTEQYAYQNGATIDYNSNLLVFTTRNGATVTFTYDALNQKTVKASSGLPIVSYLYDLAGRMTQASTSTVTGDVSSGPIQLFYDTAGRFYKETAGPSGSTLTTTKTLDLNGNTSGLTYPDSVLINRPYDQLDRLSSVSGGLGSVTFTYDALSRPSLQTAGNGIACSYQFDLSSNLLSLGFNTPGAALFDYAYNDSHQEISRFSSDSSLLWQVPGNSSITYGPVNSVNEYPWVDTATPAYQYNADGCLTNDGILTYSYDTEDRLSSVSGSGVNVGFKYDALGRQVVKSSAGVSTRLVYSGIQHIADYNSAGAITRRYVFRENANEPLWAENIATTAVSYQHVDETGSVIMASDSSGNVAKFTYSPWGECTSAPGTFGFNGQRYDSELDLYYFNARYYSPKLGRFLQNDPLGYSGDGLNLYSYVNNDPINLFDPMGLQTATFEAGRLNSGDITDYSQLGWAGGGIKNIIQNGATRMVFETFRDSLVICAAVIGSGVTAAGATAAGAVATTGTAIAGGATKFSRTLGAGTDFVSKTPILLYPRQGMEGITRGILESGRSMVMHYAGPGANRAIRGLALKIIKRVPRPTGMSFDEFPFASALEGGANSFISVVKVSEQQLQAEIHRNFYRGMQAGTRFVLSIPNRIVKP